MAQYKKHEAVEDFKRPISNSNKNKLKLKRGVFLTDTQTSDYTKSSGQMRILKLQYLEDTVQNLQKQNSELKQTILHLKANQFFQLNQEKLKQFIKDTERLRNQLEICKEELEKSLIERDFLARFNKNLKNECENLTKELLCLKNINPNTESRKLGRASGNNSSSEEISKIQYRSSSTEVILSRKKEKKKEMNQNRNSSRISDEYFIGKAINRHRLQKLNNH